MKKKEKFSENVKVRLTPEQKEAVDSVARKENISSSDVIRHALFDEKMASTYSVKIQHNLIKNEFMNKIQSMDISKNAKKKLIKELSTIGQSIL